MQIPQAPQTLALPIARRWDGAPASHPERRAWVELALHPDGLALAAGMRGRLAPRLPQAPPATRVADLWNYDVVECFLVGHGGDYLEVELGPAGHFLLLSFAAPRRLADAHEALHPEISLDASGGRVELRVPSHVLPASICALNAFAIIGGEHLAFHPVPGTAPDFHQPACFPAARLAAG